jgi:hypothetical protein
MADKTKADKAIEDAATKMRRVTVELTSETWATWKALAGMRACTMGEWLESALQHTLATADVAARKHVKEVVESLLSRREFHARPHP